MLTACFSRCQYVQHKGEIVKIDAADVGGVHAVVDEMTEDGMKVLAVAYKLMPGHSRIQPEDEAGLILLGYVVFFDAPKKFRRQCAAKVGTAPCSGEGADRRSKKRDAFYLPEVGN